MTAAVERQPTSSRHGPLVGVLGALAISLTGTRIASIALPWFVLVSTGSATATGLLALCEMLPYVLVKGLSGPWVDRVGPRRVSVRMDLVSAVAVGVVPVLWWAGSFHLGVLYAAAAVFGAARGPGDSAKEVFLPALADHGRLPMERVTGLSGSIERLASTAGPAAAGALVALAGAVPAMAVTAALALVSAAVIAQATRGLRHEPEDDDSPYLARLRGGLGIIRRDRLLLSVILMVMVTNFFDAALHSVLLPVWAKESGSGPAAIGLLSGAVAACALLGSLVATVVAERLPRRAVYLTGFMIGGAPRFVSLGLDLPLPALVAIWCLAGLGLGFINPIIGAVFFERIPRAFVGRVNAMGDAISWSLIPVGGLAAAGLIGLTGLAPALVVIGFGYLVATTVPSLRPEWHDMRRAPATAAAAGCPRT